MINSVSYSVGNNYQIFPNISCNSPQISYKGQKDNVGDTFELQNNKKNNKNQTKWWIFGSIISAVAIGVGIAFHKFNKSIEKAAKEIGITKDNFKPLLYSGFDDVKKADKLSFSKVKNDLKELVDKKIVKPDKNTIYKHFLINNKITKETLGSETLGELPKDLQDKLWTFTIRDKNNNNIYSIAYVAKSVDDEIISAMKDVNILELV